MGRRLFPLVVIALELILGGELGSRAQDSADIHVVVNMVQLNVAVTDKKGNYVTGLQPKDFAIVEDGIVEKTATFAEGDGPARNLSEVADSVPPVELGKSPDGAPQSWDEIVSGANVFILFDTSDYMYRGFVWAQDAISEFVRSL